MKILQVLLLALFFLFVYDEVGSLTQVSENVANKLFVLFYNNNICGLIVLLNNCALSIFILVVMSIGPFACVVIGFV